MTGRRQKTTLDKVYNRLVYPGKIIGQIAGRPIIEIKEPTPDEYAMLLSLLTHKKARRRWMAASRLGKLGYGRAIKPLLEALTDAHWLVRLHAAKALGAIGRLTNIDPLVVAVEDRCHYVRRAAMAALKKVKCDRDPLVTEALLRLLQSPDEGAQIDAIQYLQFTPTPSVINALAATIHEQDDTLSWAVLRAFAHIGSPAHAALDKLLEHPSPRIRLSAAIILGYEGHQRAIHYVESCLAAADPELSWSAAIHLREFRKRYPAA